MPLPDANNYSTRIYELLKETDLQNLSYSQFQQVAETLFIEPENEDEMRRLVLVQLARMAVRGDWDGFLTGASAAAVTSLIAGTNITLSPITGLGDVTINAAGASGAPSSAEYVTLATDATLTNERVLTAGSNITITDAGAGSTVTIAADASPVTSLVAGTNITLSPVTGLGDVTITAAGGAVTFPLEGSLGTNLLPTYSFTGDTNTGMYSPSGDQLGFTVGGNERLNIANNKISGIAFISTGTGTAAAPDYQLTGDADTGIFKASTNQIGFTTGGTERVRIADAGQLGIGGANYGTSGQVLTSAGPTSPPTWSASGGGSSNDFSKILPQVGLLASANQYNIATPPPWGGAQYINQALSTLGLGQRPYAFPFIAPQSGSVTAIGVSIKTADAGINLYVGIYEQNAYNQPSTRLGYATISLGATGVVYSTTLTGTMTLTAGAQYFYTISTDSMVFNAIVDAVSCVTGLSTATPLGLTDDLATKNFCMKDTTSVANDPPPSSFGTIDMDGLVNRVVVGLKF